jgi:hypothetical protein
VTARRELGAGSIPLTLDRGRAPARRGTQLRSSRRAGNLHQGPETGSSWNPTHFPRVIPATKMGPSAPGAWIPHFYSDPDTMGGGQPPMSSILTSQPGPSTGIPLPRPPHTAGPPLWVFIPSYTGHEWSLTRNSLDTADFPVHGDAQPVPSNMPIPLGYMSPYPTPLPSKFCHLLCPHLVRVM